MPAVELTIDSSGAITGLGKYDKAVDRSEHNTESSFGKMQGAVKKLAGVFAAYQLGQYLLDFGKASIMAASDMEETQGKFDVVFRNIGSYAEDAALRIANSYGMSNRESKLYLSSLQDLLVPSGLARAEAANMSVAFTELAADLGSFNNVGTAQVVRDIQSALAGGSETMTKYGINVKVSAVKAEMLALGLDTSTKAAERQSRTVALLSIMQRDSSDAMGDFARTQGSFANQTKIATANIANLRVAIGEQLLPVVNAGVTAFNEWITESGRLEAIINGLISTVQFLHNGFLGIKLVAKGVIVALTQIMNASTVLLKPLELVLGAMELIGLIDSNPVTEFREAIEMLADSAVEGFTDQLDAIDKVNDAYERTKVKVEETTVVEKAAIQSTIDLVNEKTAAIDASAKATADASAAETAASMVKANEAKENQEAQVAELRRKTRLADMLDTLSGKETELDTEVKKVKASAEASTAALEGQASAANAVAESVVNIADANQRTSATEEGTYEASKAWSGGTSSMGSSPSLTAAESSYINSMTAQGAAGVVGEHLSSTVTTADRQRWASMDALQLSSRASALQDVYDARDANDGAPVTNIMNIFNQQISTSDITTITDQQTANEARA